MGRGRFQAFADAFKSASGVVVVLYRPAWGQTQWTRVAFRVGNERRPAGLYVLKTRDGFRRYVDTHPIAAARIPLPVSSMPSQHHVLFQRFETLAELCQDGASIAHSRA